MIVLSLKPHLRRIAGEWCVVSSSHTPSALVYRALYWANARNLAAVAA